MALTQATVDSLVATESQECLAQSLHTFLAISKNTAALKEMGSRSRDETSVTIESSIIEQSIAIVQASLGVGTADQRSSPTKA